MKNFKTILAVLAMSLFSLTAFAAIKVHTIGDSTMAEYDENTTDKRGWGMYLGSFFDPAFVTVNNRGKSGADTRGFYTGAAYWASVKSQMNAGDYLIIQFAHNDEGTVTYGMDNLEYAAYCEAKGLPAPTDARGTNPQTTYRDMLRAFIDEARALGVQPVLAGPICRAYFQGNDIRRNGKHDLGDKFSKIENGILYENQSLPAGDSTMSYVKAMKVVAAEKNVPFIDLTEETRKLYLSYGETQCLNLLFCTGDKTHTNAMGGNLVARAAAQLLKNAGVLADYITIPTDITANPNAIAIGETYCGVPQNKEFLLTGYGLEPADGTVALSTTANLQISLDKVNYAATANAAYSGGSMFQKVYVRASYTSGGEQLDTVYAVSGGHKIAVPVSATAISLDGGAAVSATWAINAKPVPAAVVEGPISAAFGMSNMACMDYSKNYFTDGDETEITLARFHNSANGSSRTPWPAGEIDENAGRYLDFAITAPDAMDVRITGISMDITADATSTMCYHINTGFGEEFTGVTTIYEKRNMVNRAIEHVNLTPTLTVKAGQTLHVRVLPWHDFGEEKDSKYICLRNVVISGQAFTAGSGDDMAIDEVSQEPKANSQKLIKDGRLLIIRNGKLYNATGAQVR
jgi:lysophospholipase L1-like esterase